jgi:hypothetical protein
MITASRVKNPPKVVGYPDDPTSRVVEIDVHTEAFDETYIYCCRSESGSGNVVRLLGIEDRRGR